MTLGKRRAREGETHRGGQRERQTAETEGESETELGGKENKKDRDTERRQPSVGADRPSGLCLDVPLTCHVTLPCPDLGHLCLAHHTGLQPMP